MARMSTRGLLVRVHLYADDYIQELKQFVKQTEKETKAAAKAFEQMADAIGRGTKKISELNRNTGRLAEGLQKSFAKSGLATKKDPLGSIAERFGLIDVPKKQEKALQDAMKLSRSQEAMARRLQRPDVAAAFGAKGAKDAAKAEKERAAAVRQTLKEREALHKSITQGGLRPEQQRMAIRLQRPDVEKAFKESFDRTLNLAKDFADTLSSTISAPVRQFLSEAVDSFSRFNYELITSTSITEATAGQIKAMGNEAIKLSLEGPKSAEELARAYHNLASAGYSASESIEIIGKIEKFARAGSMQLADAVNFAADAHKALGLNIGSTEQKAASLARVMDVLVRADMIANATVQQFSVALTTQAAASLRIFNKSVEEGVAVLAVMADQGIKAHVAGTSLSRVMRLLNKSAYTNADAHRRFGFAVFDAQGKMRSFADIVENLERILNPMSEEMRASTLSALGFEARIQQAVLPLINMSHKIREYESELKRAKGTTEEVTNKQMKAFANQMKVVGNQIEFAKIKLGEQLAPVILFFAKILGGLAQAFAEMNPVMQALIAGMLTMVAILGPLGAATVGLMVAWKAMTANLVAGTFAFRAATVAAWAFKASLVAVAAAVVGLTLYHLTGFAEFDAQLKKSKELADQTTASFRSLFTKGLAEANEITNAGQRQAVLARMLKSAKNSAAALSSEIVVLNVKLGTVPKNSEEAAKAFAKFIQTGKKSALPLLKGPLEIRQAQDEVSDLEKKYKAVKEVIKEITEEMKKAAKQAEQLKETVPEVIKELQEKISLFPFKGDMRDVEKAALKHEIGGKNLEQARALARQLEAMEAAKDLREEVVKLTEDLQNQAATFGMTSEQAKVYELSLKGLKGEELKRLQGLANLRKRQEEWKDMQQEAKKITEESRTPLQKFNERMVELNKLFQAGLLTKPVFLQAVQKAKLEFDEASDSAKKAKDEIQKLDGVLFGSAEARTRISAFQQQFSFANRMLDPNAVNKTKPLFQLPKVLRPGMPGDNFGVKPGARMAVEDADRAKTVALLTEAVRLLGQMANNKDPKVGPARINK